MLANRFAHLLIIVVTVSSLAPQSAQGGPLIDWLFGYNRSGPAYPVGQPVPLGTTNVANYGQYAQYGQYGRYAPSPQTAQPGYAANYGNYYGSSMPVIGPAGAGYPAGQPSGIVGATLPSALPGNMPMAAAAPPIVSYVPDYRSSYYRAPVTYYRPLLTTDPNTNSQVVALAPCTSYEYRTQRVPTFGYNGVLGSYNTPPVQPAAPAVPTYTLPSGGVPLASTPSITAPYSASYGVYPSAVPFSSNTSGYSTYYGNYSALQPNLAGQPIVTQPIVTQPIVTQPMVTQPGYGTQPSYAQPTTGNHPTSNYVSPYYGTTTGGSTGGYSAPTTSNIITPGAGYSGQPYAPLPTNSFPINPVNPNTIPIGPNTMPSNVNPGVFPPANGTVPNTGVNPADIQPTLPPTGNASLYRPQLRGITREPLTPNSSLNNSRLTDENPKLESPLMSPIPVPEDFESEQRWNPGLLNEQDKTASRNKPAINSNLYAWQSKPIQWASFEDRSAAQTPSKPVASSNEVGSRLRPAPAPTQSTALQNGSQLQQPAQTAPASSRYRTDGWKAVR